MRKLAAPFLTLGLALVLTGAAAAASEFPAGPTPHVFNDDGMTLQLTPAMPGITFVGDTLVCPPVVITTSSGIDQDACAFTISSVGSVAPDSIAVTMSARGITGAQAAAHKFAIVPMPGTLAYVGLGDRTIYAFAGAQLPVTVVPGVAWGSEAGSELDNGDLGTTIVVTYTVVAESLAGETATPYQSVAGETGTPGGTSTPPPTASSSGFPGGNTPAPLVALAICLLLAAIGLGAVERGRRSVRRLAARRARR